MTLKSHRISPLVLFFLAIAAVFGGIALKRMMYSSGLSSRSGVPEPTFEQELAATKSNVDWTPTGTEGGRFDWENPTSSWNRGMIDPNFSSPRKVEQTTAFIAWALNRYGFTAKSDRTVVSEVRFTGCVMKWRNRWYMGQDYVNEKNRTVNLGHLRVRPDRSDVYVASDYIRLYADQDHKMEELNRYWQKQDGRMVERVAANTSTESQIIIPIQPTDNMNVRVAHALVHAAKLCGAQ